MHRIPHSPPPADFHVAAAGWDVAGLFTDAQYAASEQDQDRPSTMSRARWKLSRHPGYLDDASVWWSNLVPVATSGWGVLTVIASILITPLLVWATGERRAE